MRTSDDRILTTHVGSLPRLPELDALLIRRNHGKEVDAAKFAAAVDRSCARERTATRTEPRSY